MTDPRLFRMPRAYQATIRLELVGSWTLIIDHLYDGEPWSIDDREVYGDLSLLECHQVLLEEISKA